MLGSGIESVPEDVHLPLTWMDRTNDAASAGRCDEVSGRSGVVN